MAKSGTHSFVPTVGEEKCLSYFRCVNCGMLAFLAYPNYYIIAELYNWESCKDFSCNEWIIREIVK